MNVRPTLNHLVATVGCGRPLGVALATICSCPSAREGGRTGCIYFKNVHRLLFVACRYGCPVPLYGLVHLPVVESAIVVSISRLSIAYYLSTVAKGDVPQATSKPLTAYYTETATPPGRWWGSGLAGLSGLASGQQ